MYVKINEVIGLCRVYRSIVGARRGDSNPHDPKVGGF